MIMREMTEADLPAVLELERSLFPEDAWSQGMFREELRQRPDGRYYVLAEEEPAGVLGYAGLAAAYGAGDVQTIGVRPGHWGRGIGAALYEDVLGPPAGALLPTATALAELAVTRLSGAAGPPLLPPEPLYLRRPDARAPGARKKVTPA